MLLMIERNIQLQIFLHLLQLLEKHCNLLLSILLLPDHSFSIRQETISFSYNSLKLSALSPQGIA